MLEYISLKKKIDVPQLDEASQVCNERTETMKIAAKRQVEDHHLDNFL